VAYDFSRCWRDPSFLRDVQYASDANLAARQSIYAHADPLIDLPAAVVDSLSLGGTEVVADVGCGNGAYLTELTRRGHQGGVLGLDASHGMLRAARRHAASAALLVADAMALPIRAGSAQVVLAMHMLHHVPDVAQAVSELRRVWAPGGQVVVGLNADDHLRQMREVIFAVLDRRGRDAGRFVTERLRLDDGAELLAGYFRSVTRHDFVSELKVPGPGPVEDYVRSMTLTADQAEQDQIVTEISSRLDFGSDGLFRVTTHSGCLICR
jgi:SAM-dependent methyltransferase